MKLRAVVIALALPFFGLGIASESLATTAAENPSVFRWKHFGTAKFAETREDAMLRRREAFQCLGLPPDVIEKAMKATAEHKGEKVRLVNEQYLDAMLSTNCVKNSNVLIAFVKPPMGGMEYSAPAEQWEIKGDDGNIYLIFLPEVCNNWAFRMVIPIRKDPCVELTFRIPEGATNAHVRWGVASNDGPLPPSACNAQKEGNGSWKAWYGECDECVPAYGYIRRTMGASATVPHRYYYKATAREQTIRFSTHIWDRLGYVCLEYTLNGRVVHTCGVYVPPGEGNGAWQRRHAVDIADSLWLVDNGKCPGS